MQTKQRRRWTARALAIALGLIVTSAGVMTTLELGGCDTYGSQARTLDASRASASRSIYSGLTETYENESYDSIYENRFADPRTEPLSTFAIDVDTASYSNVRRFIDDGRVPPAGAVRIEECVNYFDYSYEPPTSASDPFAIHVEIADCPWQPDHRLAAIGIRGYEVKHEERPPANLVFVIDVSGSMHAPDKLPLLKRSLSMLVRDMRDDDSIGIVIYAGAAKNHLRPTSARRREKILNAIADLEANGSTNGAGGLDLGYAMAEDHFIEGGINRVIIASDGDFNVGLTSESELVRLIEKKRETGIFLSVLGFGTGNYQDDRMEALADHGNGNYAYIDSLHEARRVLIDRMGSTLVTIAKDVKIQVEFNAANVRAYRLLGYENRMLAARDFNDDRVDGGEIGAGHCVTALYEIVPADVEFRGPTVDELRYLQPVETKSERLATDHELFFVKLRYKDPDGEESRPVTRAVRDEGLNLSDSSDDFRWAASVAAFCMLLRDSEYVGNATFDEVIDLARHARADDPNGSRSEFLDLARTARELKAAQMAATDP